ncbi:molecular chaperone DnaJ, partial [Pseudomonas frederiksbergensis]|nr:molecular chaperone DnaJ [Pseudomonas frederiksbergensis]
MLNLYAKQQPQRLPLLIQAMDRLDPVYEWPQDLNDPGQIWGSPSQRPETVTRLVEAARNEYEGIAGIYVKWYLDGEDELPLLAWLLDDQPDRQLQRLYRHAWALTRGDSGLLRQILDEPLGDDPLEILILEGFKYQAEQQLRWLNQSPLALALTAFINSPSAHPQLPEVL